MGSNIKSEFLYTVEEVRQILGVGRNKIYDMIHNKEFPLKRSGKKIIIPKQSFDEWLLKG